MVEVRQARGPRARSRQDVDLRDLELAREHLAVSKRALALVAAMSAVLGSSLAVVSGERPLLPCSCALLGRGRPLPGSVRDGIDASDGLRGGLVVVGVELCHREISHVGGVVSSHGAKITAVSGLISHGGGIEAHARGLLLRARGCPGWPHVHEGPGRR
jgi:hypothetical protein